MKSYTVRKMTPGGLEKFPGYRLEWDVDADEQIAQILAEVSTAPAAPAPRSVEPALPSKPEEPGASAEATSEVATPPQPVQGEGVFPLSPELITLQAVLRGVGNAHLAGIEIDAGVEAAITAEALAALGATKPEEPVAEPAPPAPVVEVSKPAAPPPAPEKTATNYPRVSPKKLTMLPGDRIEEGGDVAGFEGTYLITPISFISLARAFYNKCIAALGSMSPELNDLLTTQRRLMIRLRVINVSDAKFKLALSANVKGFEKECDALKASLLTIAHNRFPDCEEVVLEELNYPELTTPSEQVAAQAVVTPRVAQQPVAPQRATPAAVRTDTANAVARSSQPVAVPHAAAASVVSSAKPKVPQSAPPGKAVTSSQISLAPVSAGNAVAALRGIAKIPGEGQWIAPVAIEKLGYIQSVRLLASYSDQKAAQSLAEYLLKILASSERVDLNAEVAGQSALVVRLRKRDERGSDYVLGINVAGGGRFAQQFMTELRSVFNRSHPGKALILEELRSSKDS